MDVIEQEGFAHGLGRVTFVGVSQGSIIALDAVASGRWKIGTLASSAGRLAAAAFARNGANGNFAFARQGRREYTVKGTRSGGRTTERRRV